MRDEKYTNLSLHGSIRTTRLSIESELVSIDGKDSVVVSRELADVDDTLLEFCKGRIR